MKFQNVGRGVFMKTKSVNIFWGIVLVGLGILFLLNEMEMIELQNLSDLVWTLIFGVIAAFFFITYFLKNKQEWGWLFPATICTGIALVIGLDGTGIGRMLSGAPIMLGIAAPFLVAYLSDPRSKQWALIPTWVLTVIAGVILLERYMNGNLVGALVLYSIALPFLYAYLTDKSRQWALIPFTVLSVIGTIPLLGLFVSGAWFDVVVVSILAVPFFAVYFWSKKNWWALIPAGVFTSIALGLFIEQLFHVEFPAEIFLGGLGLTFGILWLLREKYSTDWAKYPSLALLGVAGIVLVTEETTSLVGPVVLVVVGIAILVVSLLQRSRKSENSEKQIEK